MVDVETLRRSISKTLDEEEELRERAYSLSRSLIRSCRQVISDLVREGNPDRTAMDADLKELLKIARDFNFKFPFVEDALVEYSEASILRSILEGDGLPDPESMGISNRAYILGACDAVGELRRVTLNRLLRSELDGAMSTFEMMGVLGHLIEGMTYPSGMIPLKKKQDTVRSLLDRTAGELVVAIRSRGEG